MAAIDSSRPNPAFDSMTGQMLIKSARLARKSGDLEAAFGYITQATSFHQPEVFLEYAKYFYAKGEISEAISVIEKWFDNHPTDISQPSYIDNMDNNLKEIYAKALVLCGKCCEETCMKSMDISGMYEVAIKLCPNWDGGYFYLAKFSTKIIKSLTDCSIEELGKYINLIIPYYGSSLKYGDKHLYHALPQLLSLWLDYGESVVDLEKTIGRSEINLMASKSELQKLNECIKKLNEELPPYKIFTAFPQLISRICHPQAEVFQQLEEIIIKLVIEYPHEILWGMMIEYKSSHQMKVARCANIFSKAMRLPV